MKKATGKPQKDDETTIASNATPEKPSTDQIWTLEEVFPDVGELLSPSKRASAADDDVLVVLDTNVLLLPFRVGTQELPRIEDVYKKLIDSKRLFVPARAVREFIDNRDVRLAEIAKSLHDKGSEASSGRAEIPPLLRGLPEANSLTEVAERLETARKEYVAATNALVARIHGWRGDDPVTSMYHKLFTSGVVIDVDESLPQIERDWQERLRKKIPPGYKDGSKPDTGVGDFVIWLALLKLGRIHKKSLIFVTGEEKGDWFVRANGKGVYPRPELVAEFRRASNGKHLHLYKLAKVLSDMNAPADVVQEVREAEDAADTAIQLAGRGAAAFVGRASVSVQDWTAASGNVTFDYSTNNGTIVVGNDRNRFELKFGKASDTSIHLYRSNGTPLVSRAKNVSPGEIVSFDTFDSSSRAYTIQVGEVFLAKNTKDQVLAGRIHRIEDDTRGAPSDEVTFSYSIFGPGERIVAP
jgi:hypothetical protein